MSTILKALRRLEEEKATRQGPRPLREEVATPALAQPSIPGRGLWVAVGGATLLALGAGAWWLAADRNGSDAGPGTRVAAREPAPAAAPTVEATPAVAPAPSVVAERSDALRVAEPEREGLPAEAFASQVEVVPRPPVRPRVPIESPLPRPVGVAASDADTARPERPGARRPYPAPAAPGASEGVSGVPRSRALASARDAAPVAAATAAAPPAVAPVATPPHGEARLAPSTTVTEPAPAPHVASATPATSAPVAAAPAPKARASAPPAPAPVASAPKPTPPPAPELEVRVERTLWHPQPDRRTAIVLLESGATRTVHEGDRVDGARVAEIQPSGVVFERDGQTLRRGIASR